jgi:hypothetical protein
MPRPGSKSFAAFQASISKARSIAAHTTGRSGAGTASEPAPTCNRPNSKLRRDRSKAVHGHPLHPSDCRTVRCSVTRGQTARPLRGPLVQTVQTVRREVVLVPPVRMVHATADDVPTDRAEHASRSTRQGGAA